MGEALFHWSDGFLYRYDVAAETSDPVANVRYDGYEFDRGRGLIWLYRTLGTDGVEASVEIEALEITGSAEPMLFAHSISPEFTAVSINGQVTVHGGSIMSEGYCYEDTLSASPCNMALAWSEPTHLELEKVEGAWETTSGRVLGGEWYDSWPVSTVEDQSSEMATNQPLPNSMVDTVCECWGDEGECGSAVTLSTGSLHLVTTGLDCGDMMYQSCGIYDSSAEGYYRFSGGDIEPSDRIGVVDPLESEESEESEESNGFEVDCSLLQPAGGGWFATARGMVCSPGDEGQLRCHSLDGHLVGWTPGIQPLHAPY
jgi:hypothetical protein